MLYFARTVLNRLPKWILVRPVDFRTLTYVQGQSPEPNLREYFYYIDHQGMLFLDDARIKNFTSCFKEKKFLVFFFTRLKANTRGRYSSEFPYVSPCGREMNYVRCDDRPVVFTHLVSQPSTGAPVQNQHRNDADDVTIHLSYGHAGDQLLEPFRPSALCMFPRSGRVYHPSVERLGGIGLVKSSLAIEFSRLFLFGNGETSSPTHFVWNGVEHRLTNELVDRIPEPSD